MKGISLIIIITFIFLIMMYHVLHRRQYIYKRNILDKKDYDMLCEILKREQPHTYSRNWNGLRMKKIMDRRVRQLFHKKVCDKLSNILSCHLIPSAIPIEYRVYERGNGMKWHRDTLLHKPAQYEVVYTVWNTSDSKTEYIDHWGITHSVHTEPNSIMLVRAGGYKHRVLPVEKGKRYILKIAYVPKKR